MTSGWASELIVILFNELSFPAGVGNKSSCAEYCNFGRYLKQKSQTVFSRALEKLCLEENYQRGSSISHHINQKIGI